MRCMTFLGLALTWGCGAELDDVSDASTLAASDDSVSIELHSACGETSLVDLRVEGRVVDEMGDPVVGVEVWIEERSWFHEIYGRGISEVDGAYAFDVFDVPMVDGCLGVGPQFFAVGEGAEGWGEVEGNFPLSMAWLDGTHVADFRYRTIVVPMD